MKRIFTLFCTFLIMLSSKEGYSQYADGSGLSPHQDKIFWLRWDKAAMTSSPASFTSSSIVEGTYIWELEPGAIRVVGTLSNFEIPVAPTSGTLSIIPYISGSYKGNISRNNLGDGLQLLYPGVNPIGMATSNSSTNASYANGVIEFDIDLKLQILINGTWKDTNYPGIVIADAESMASGDGTNYEYISAETNGDAWQIFDIRNEAAVVNKNPLDYKLEIANNGKYFKLYNNTNVSNMGVQAVMFAQGTSTLHNVQMKGEGKTALAIGFMAPFDYGDAPRSYGEAAHFMNNLTTNGTPITQNGIYSVVEQQVATQVTALARIYINEQPDADGSASHFSENADSDGATKIPFYSGNGTYSLTLPITNTTDDLSNLAAWIDWNQNGKFDESEGVFLQLSSSATTATLEWTNAPLYPNPTSKYFVRVRISTDPINDPNLGARDGEVEDYYLETATAISGNVFNDANGLSNNTVDGTGTNVDGQLYVNLVDANGIVLASTPVAANGFYIFGGQLPSGDYSLQLTTQRGEAGAFAPSVELPTNWITTGEYVGRSTGNDGQANGILPLTISEGVVVTEANFGIEQLLTNDTKSYSIDTPILNTYLVLNGGETSDAPSPLTAKDPEDGALSTSKTVIIENLSEMNGNQLYYGNSLISEGTVIENYDPSLLSIKFTDAKATSSTFTFTFLDEAGKEGVPATYTISWNSTPLPVTLINFTAASEGNSAILNWATTSETNSDLFEIERSNDAKNWYKIGNVTAQGESSSFESYSFNDQNPLNGTNFYRLKSVDKDSSFTYSRLQSLAFDKHIQISIFPNPVSSTLSVNEIVTGSLKETILYSSTGQKIYHSTKEGSVEIDVNALPTGIYIIRTVLADGSAIQHRIVVTH